MTTNTQPVAPTPATQQQQPPVEQGTTWNDRYVSYLGFLSKNILDVNGCFGFNSETSTLEKIAKVVFAIFSSILLLPLALINVAFSKVKEMFSCCRQPQPQAPPANPNGENAPASGNNPPVVNNNAPGDNNAPVVNNNAPGDNNAPAGGNNPPVVNNNGT